MIRKVPGHCEVAYQKCCDTWYNSLSALEIRSSSLRHGPPAYESVSATRRYAIVHIRSHLLSVIAKDITKDSHTNLDLAYGSVVICLNHVSCDLGLLTRRLAQV